MVSETLMQFSSVSTFSSFLFEQITTITSRVKALNQKKVHWNILIPPWKHGL